MTISKKQIIKKITEDSSLSKKESHFFLDSLLSFIKKNVKSNTVKLSSVGTFSLKKTPKRPGRNPKTQDSYIIPDMIKLNFKPSNKIKEKIN